MENVKDDRIPDIDAIAESQHEMWQSEWDEATQLGMTVAELREEKELKRIQQEELDNYENLSQGVY